MSEHSRLPVLCPAAPIATLAPRLNRSVAAMLLAGGVEVEAAARELSQMTTGQFGPTHSRSLVGTMTEYIKTLEYQQAYQQEYQQEYQERGHPDLEPPDLGHQERESLEHQALFLNQLIWKPIDYQTPAAVTCQ